MILHCRAWSIHCLTTVNRPSFPNENIRELADCYRHINYNHQGPETEFSVTNKQS